MAQQRTTPISLEGFYSHFDFEDCLFFIGWAMGKADWEERDLPSRQSRLLNDLQRGLDEEALAHMLDFWTYDFDRLYQRERPGWGVGRAPAKPEIDVKVEITSKGNLKAEWFPRTNAFGEYEKSDFPRFMRFEQRGSAFTTRPSNELLFLHEVQEVIYDIDEDYGLLSRELTTPLLAATKRLVARLRERLEPHFDVRMVADVRLKWNGRNLSEASLEAVSDRILAFEIVDPAEVARQRDLEELNSMEADLGFSEVALMDAKQHLEQKQPKTGPAPSPHTLTERLNREMKRRGFPSTHGKIKKALSLIEKYRATDNVVALRR